jgi:hypothetical protein
MTAPWHEHASVPLPGSPSAIQQRLVADPAGIVANATGLALSRLEPLLRSWGLPPSTLPGVTARPTAQDEVGAVELAWTGDEDATAWPSLLARLLVVPDHAATDSRLVFLTPRSPRAELATRRVGRLHRERILDVAVQRFLREVAAQVAGHGTLAPVGPPVTQFDRRPVFVHHAVASRLPATALARALMDDPGRLADQATSAALEAAAAPLAAGRFRCRPAPDTHVMPTPPGSTGVLELGWTSDEEATGWPQITLTLAVEAATHGTSRLLVLSGRTPGYDLSTNRMDKRARDQILRQLGGHVATAVADGVLTTVELSSGTDTAHQQLVRT